MTENFALESAIDFFGTTGLAYEALILTLMYICVLATTLGNRFTTTFQEPFAQLGLGNGTNPLKGVRLTIA